MHPFFWEPTHNYTYTNWLLILHNFAAMKQNILLFFLIFLFLRASAQIPNGYYNTATGSGAALKTQLYNIIKGHTVVNYDDLYSAYTETDDQNNGGVLVWDMYSNCNYNFSAANQCGNYQNECDCYNREHSMPQSWFNSSSPMVSDLFHVYPTDGKVNGMRSNYPFGEVSSPTYTSGNGSKRGSCSYPGYTGVVFEPIDEYKGDFARTYFYMATRYENVIGNWQTNGNANEVLDGTSFPCYDTWFLNMLGEWHVQDPVSTKEIDRNNVVYASYQHNRNPFIDHPEYVYAIWGVGASGILAVSTSTLTGFTYTAGSGPSTSQSFNLSGSNLTGVPGNITVTAPTDFEVSGNNSSFGSSIQVAYASATLASTPVYVRLKAGLTQGNYNSETITIAGGGASTVSVTCSGSVTTSVLPEPTNYPTQFSAHNILLEWNDAEGSVQPDGYLIRMSSVSFADIQAPVDGNTYNSASDFTAPSGQEYIWIKNLTPNTTYYFKLFGYTGSGSGIDYKTDGSVPQVAKQTGL